MRQRLLFVWHVLIFNVIKPFPYSSCYFNNHFRSPTQNNLFSCLVTSSYWTLTCVFLTAFENIGLLRRIYQWSIFLVI